MEDRMFQVSSAKQKAVKDDPPTQASMRASSNEKVRRNPGTDQRKVRRLQHKKGGFDAQEQSDRDALLEGARVDSRDAVRQPQVQSRPGVRSGLDRDARSHDRVPPQTSRTGERQMSKKAMTKMAWSIDQVRQVLDSGATKVDGMLLDHFSASALVQIYDALSPENQAKLEAMPLDRAMDIVWKLASKTGSRDTEQYVVRGGDNVELASEVTASRRTAQNYAGLAVRGADGYEYDWGYEFDDDYANTEGEPAVIVFLYDRDGEVVDSMGGITLSSLSISDHGNLNLSNADEKYLYNTAQELASNAHVGSRRTAAPEGVYNEDGEPLGFDYPSEPGEDDSFDEDEFYDDFAHEAKIERHAIADEFDLRPLHTRVATAFLKKG